MPVTKFQRDVLNLIKKHRNPNSYVAGGIAIHRSERSLRYSNDIDFFHDTDEAVTTCHAADRKILTNKGYDFKILINQPAFVRAVISKGSESLKLEWVRDTAFRFFPVIEDSDLGFRLHDVDLATNKCLALANRTEVRDIVDLIQQHREVLSLTGIVWAACGKDPGFTPSLMLNCMRRNSIIRPEQLAAEALTKKFSPTELKTEWMALLEQAESAVNNFPASELGCIYLSDAATVIRAPNLSKIKDAQRHFGSVGGSWPRRF